MYPPISLVVSSLQILTLKFYRHFISHLAFYNPWPSQPPRFDNYNNKMSFFIWKLSAVIPFQLVDWINVPDSVDSQQARLSSDGKWQTMLVRYNKAPVLSGGYKSLGSSLCNFLNPRHFLPLSAPCSPTPSACVPPLPSDFLLQFARSHIQQPATCIAATTSCLIVCQRNFIITYNVCYKNRKNVKCNRHTACKLYEYINL